jgi:hypothetical protein
LYLVDHGYIGNRRRFFTLPRSTSWSFRPFGTDLASDIVASWCLSGVDTISSLKELLEGLSTNLTYGET